jgi:SAM-dependent methyltransferase
MIRHLRGAERQRRKSTLLREGANAIDEKLPPCTDGNGPTGPKPDLIAQPKESAEFDQYAASYSRLLRDPIRDSFASQSEFFHRRKWMLIRDFLAERKLTLSSLTWLDIGCGQGDLLKAGGSEFARAVGCDPSAEMIAACAPAEIQRQDSPTDLPFANDSFDLVTAVCVYHHVHGDARTLLTKSIHRVLKPGGVFCLIEHNPWNPVTQLIVKRCAVDRDAELVAASQAARLMRLGNLEIIETVYFLYFPERIFKHMSSMENSLRRLPLGGQFATFCRKRAGE